MKTIIFLFCFFINSCLVTAEPSDTTFNYKNDNILKKIFSVLPSGWKFFEKDGFIIIERTDSVTMINRRQINKFSLQKIQDDTIMKYGFKAKSSIVYKYEKRWTYENTVKANGNNMLIYQQLQKLPEKYNISKLFNKSESTKINTVYKGSDKQEIMLIEQYEKEKDMLESQLIKLPDYHTEKYSLFLVSKYGCNDDEHSVLPAEASIQLYDILILFRELTEKSLQK